MVSTENLGNRSAKVTVFSTATLPLKSGAGLHAFRLARGMQGKGVEVRLVTCNWGKLAFQRTSIENVRIRRVPYFYRGRIQKFLSVPIQLPFFLYYLLVSDLVLVYGPMPGYLAVIFFGAILRKRVVYRSTMLGVDDLISLIYKYPNIGYL